MTGDQKSPQPLPEALKVATEMRFQPEITSSGFGLLNCSWSTRRSGLRRCFTVAEFREMKMQLSPERIL